MTQAAPPITNGHSNGAPTANVEQLQRQLAFFKSELVQNVTSMRQGIFRHLFDPRRDVEDEVGYPRLDELIDVEKYQQLYDRDAVAARVVEVLPRESWQVQPLVYEEEDAEKVTPFEEAWDAVGAGLMVSGGQSWFRQEEGSAVWEYLQRLDILSGIGHFAVLLFGLDDVGPKTGLTLADPVKGVEEKFSAPSRMQRDSESKPKGYSTPSVNGIYNLTVNAKATKSRRLLYLRVFHEPLVQIQEYEANPTSPRYGQPTRYLLSLSDPRQQWGATGMQSSTVEVHWTRVLHAADNLKASEIFGPPRMQPVLNNLLGIHKILAADPEAHWKNCLAKLILETQPQLGGDVEVDKGSLRDQMEQFGNGMQPWLSLMGMSAKTLPPAMVDPTPHVAVQIEAICIKLGVPKRVFMGSERGELASSQDDQAWNDRLRARQRDYLTPRLIVPFVDRLVMLGVLPEPESYCVEWPDLASQTDLEKADVAAKRTNALSVYVQSGAEAIVPPFDFLTRWVGFTEEEAASILEAAEQKAEEEIGEGGTQSPLLGTVGGMTGTIDLFKAAKEGAISEEQLQQLLMLFFKLSEDQAAAVIADGLTPAAGEAGMGMEAEVEKDKVMIDEGLKPDPLEKEPPAPVKVKDGERLIVPKAGGKPFGG